MKTFTYIFSRIWGVWFYLWLLIIFFLLYPIFAISLSRPKWYPIAHKARRIWGKALFRVSLMFYKVTYEKPIPKNRSFIYCSNHASYADIPMMTIAVPGFFNYMAKAELMKVPLFGKFFRTIDIPVNRKSMSDSFKAFQRAAYHVQKGHSIVLYPEGTIPDHTPHMKKFKNGPFKLAIENKIPIIPITFADNWRLLPDDGRFTALPGVLRAYVHQPVETKDLSLEDIDKLNKQVHDIIHNKLVDFGVLKQHKNEN